MCVWPVTSQAQTKQTFVFKDGKVQNAGTKIVIPKEQAIMFEAAKKTTARDYKAADTLYTKAIAINNGNISAYLQRGLVRRQLGDERGAGADAERAIALVNLRLKQAPDDAELYYQRSLGARLLGQFNAAEKDLRYAISLSSRSEWENDLKALELEKRMANVR